MVMTGCERVKCRRGQRTSIGDRSELLCNLLKKPRGHLSGIGVEVLARFDEKCGVQRPTSKAKWGASASHTFERT